MSKGRQGELLFKQIMECRVYTVEDVSGNPDYWYRDIDFIVTSPTTGQVKTFEVKWDSCINRTGNLYLEHTNIHSKGGKGWYNFCQADYLVYGDAVAQVFYVIPFGELKEKVKSLHYRAAAQKDGDSIGQLVAISAISDIVFQL